MITDKTVPTIDNKKTVCSQHSRGQGRFDFHDISAYESRCQHCGLVVTLAACEMFQSFSKAIQAAYHDKMIEVPGT